MMSGQLQEKFRAFLRDERGGQAVEFGCVAMFVMSVVLPLAQVYGARIVGALALYLP